MANSLVFNYSAEDLKVQIYGLNGSQVTPVSVDGSGNLAFSGSVTVTNASLTVAGTVTVGNSITIANTSLTVAGTVTVGNSITIANTSLTVAGTVTVGNSITIANTSLTVAGTVTVGNSITIANASLTVAGTVTVGNTVSVTNVGALFVSDSITVTSGALTGSVLQEDISQLRQCTYFIKNNNASTLTVVVQASPTTTSSYFTDFLPTVAVLANSTAIVEVGVFMNYVRLRYQAIGLSASFEAYFNGQA